MQGTLGILDVATRGYTTLMRSHTGRVLTLSVDPIRRQLVTASEDHTIRIWDMDTMQQVLLRTFSHNYAITSNATEINLFCGRCSFHKKKVSISFFCHVKMEIS